MKGTSAVSSRSCIPAARMRHTRGARPGRLPCHEPTSATDQCTVVVGLAAAAIPKEEDKMFQLLRRLGSEDEGQGMVEYALIIGLVAVVLIVALRSMEGGITGVFNRIRTTLDGIGS